MSLSNCCSPGEGAPHVSDAHDNHWDLTPSNPDVLQLGDLLSSIFVSTLSLISAEGRIWEIMQNSQIKSSTCTLEATTSWVFW